MAKRSYLTLEQKAEILVEKNGRGLTPTEISQNTGIARTTIISFLDRFDKTKMLSTIQRRPKKVNDNIRQQIVQQVSHNPLSHIRDQAAHVPVGRETVRKVLHEEKFDYYPLTPVSPLTDQHIIDRINYCNTVINNGMQPIVFTDESTAVVDLSGSGI